MLMESRPLHMGESKTWISVMSVHCAVVVAHFETLKINFKNRALTGGSHLRMIV